MPPSLSQRRPHPRLLTSTVLLAQLVATSAAVAATRSRKAKVMHLAEALSQLNAAEAPIAVAYLAGELPQGRVGVGYRAVYQAADRAVSDAAGSSGSGAAGDVEHGAQLTILEVHDILDRLAAESGTGSQARRAALLDMLLLRAVDDERQFLKALLTGGLRQGALEGVMADALAAAAAVPAASVRRAAMITGSLVAVSGRLLTEGAQALEGLRLQVLTALQPMLAQSADSCADALARTGEASVEVKLDGARIQVHRQGQEVRVFTRNLRDVTAALPEVAAAAAQLHVEAVILDGEAIALGADGAPLPFQETISRFSRQAGTAGGATGSAAAVAVSPVFFDCLHLDGEDLIDRPAPERHAALDRACPRELRVERLVTDDPEAAERLLEQTLAAGHEGVMVKSLASSYEAGRRGVGWIKVKRAKTLDLVVLAVEWGSGRRTGKLSNLHLGARDPESGGFVMLGKTFKGMTDAMLDWQTERFLELETERQGHVVHVRPEQVVEIAFDAIQASRRYPGGMALRFARVKGYRDDKGPADADTIDTVRKLFRRGRRDPTALDSS